MNETLCKETCVPPLLCKHFDKVGIDCFVCTQAVDGLFMWDVLIITIISGIAVAGLCGVVSVLRCVLCGVCRRVK